MWNGAQRHGLHRPPSANLLVFSFSSIELFLAPVWLASVRFDWSIMIGIVASYVACSSLRRVNWPLSRANINIWRRVHSSVSFSFSAMLSISRAATPLLLTAFWWCLLQSSALCAYTQSETYNTHAYRSVCTFSLFVSTNWSFVVLVVAMEFISPNRHVIVSNMSLTTEFINSPSHVSFWFSFERIFQPLRFYCI